MTGPLTFFLSLFIILATAHGVLLNANNRETCRNLCTSCKGLATFDKSICDCSVPANDVESLECVKRLQQEKEDLGLESASENDDTSERPARCSLLHGRRRLGSTDGRRVADYFMKGGPLLGSPLSRSHADCAPATGDSVVGAVNPRNAVPRRAEDEVEQKQDSPVAESSADSCSSSQYQPIVASPWIPTSIPAYAPQAYHPAALYPPMVGSYPHFFVGIPQESVKSHPHASNFHPRLFGGARHTPIVSPLASRTRAALQRLDKMMAPCATERNNKILGATQGKSNCEQSSQSVLGAPAPASRAQSSQISDSTLQQSLACQNAFLENLISQLRSNGQQVGAPRMHYAPVAVPMQYMLAAPQPIGQLVAAQPPNQYCPDGSSAGGPNLTQTWSAAPSSSPKNSENVAEPRVSSSSDIASDEEPSSFTEQDAQNETMTSEMEQSGERDIGKFKRQTQNSSEGNKDAEQRGTTVSEVI